MNPKDAEDVELEPSAEERAEAEAVARALDAAATGAAPPPDDDLAAAALLRHARREEDAGESVRTDARIGAAAARSLPAVDQRRPRRRWLRPVLLVPASAAALLVLFFLTSTTIERSRKMAGMGSTTMIPAPSVALLEAQANAAHPGGDLAALDRQMREYRRSYYAALGGGSVEEP